MKGSYLFLQWSSKVLLLPQARCMEKLLLSLDPSLVTTLQPSALVDQSNKGSQPSLQQHQDSVHQYYAAMSFEPKTWDPKSLPSRSASLPLPQPCPSLHTPAHQHKHFRASASSTFFDDSVLPEYSIDQKDTDAPSFSQVVLTLDPTWSFIQPVTNPSNQAIPLYAISTDLNEDRSHITTIQRLYHKFSDTPSPSSKGARVKRTSLPVYEIGPGRTRCELKPLLESASYLELVHAERNMDRGAARWEIKVLIEKTGEDAEANTKNELVRGKTETITRRKYRTQSTLGDEGAIEWIDRNDEVVAYQLQLVKERKEEIRMKSEAAADLLEGLTEALRERGVRRRQEGSPRRSLMAMEGGCSCWSYQCLLSRL